MHTPSELTSIELFTGAGGLALGVDLAGFRHLDLVEWNKEACATLNANIERLPVMKDWPRVEPRDVKDVRFKSFADRVTLLAAGAPCQPFSLGGKHAGDQDHRNLFPQVFRVVREVRPQVVIVENVKGLLRSSFTDYFEYIKLQLAFPECGPRPSQNWRDHLAKLAKLVRKGVRTGLTYSVSHQLLNAADFGLPQRRDRVFIVAFRNDLGLEWTTLKPTHSADSLLFSQWFTGSYWREHGLTKPSIPVSLQREITRFPRQSSLFEEPQGQRWQTVRDGLRGLPEPVDHIDNERFTNHVGNPGARSYPGHTGSQYDWPAKTLKAGDHGVPGGENTLVRDDGSIRYFTVREAACLQGFPRDYLFRGAWCEGFRQLGNAVPVELARVVASRARDILTQASSTPRVA